MIFKHILEVPARIPAQFPYVKIIILKQKLSKIMKNYKNRYFQYEMLHSYPLRGAYWYMHLGIDYGVGSQFLAHAKA